MKEIGRGGGDRNDKYINKACALNALQPRAPANRNLRNKLAAAVLESDAQNLPPTFRCADLNTPKMGLDRIAIQLHLFWPLGLST